MTVTFESMGQVLAEIYQNQERILNLLESPEQKEPEKLLFTIDELINYLPEKPAKQTVYGWITHGKVPYEKHGRSVYFRKTLIDKWLNDGRVLDKIN